MTESRTPRTNTFTRRGALIGTFAVLAGGATAYFFPLPGLGSGSVRAQSGYEGLMAPGPLPENVMGDETAPNTVIEYSSMTCPHCAHFHKEVVPELKLKYVETGKARYIIREYPIGAMALAAAMLARCAGPEKYFPFTDVMYARQEEWVPGPKEEREARLFKMAQQAGFTKESFEKCLLDSELRDKIMAVRNRASEKFGVDATPTIFVNGTFLKAPQTMAEIEKHLKLE